MMLLNEQPCYDECEIRSLLRDVARDREDFAILQSSEDPEVYIQTTGFRLEFCSSEAHYYVEAAAQAKIEAAFLAFFRLQNDFMTMFDWRILPEFHREPELPQISVNIQNHGIFSRLKKIILFKES